jgi:hypothetical protein
MPILLLRSHGYRPCRTKKEEVALMRQENETPANRRRRLHAALYRPYTRASTMLVVLLVVLVGILAAIVMGPGRVIDWLGAYLIPVLVVLGVIVGVFGLAAWEIAKLHDNHKQPW